MRGSKRVRWRHKLLILQFRVTYEERVRGIRVNHPPTHSGCLTLEYETAHERRKARGGSDRAHALWDSRLSLARTPGSSRNTKTAPDKSGAFKLFPATVSSIRNDQGPPFGSNNLAVTTTRRNWRYRMQCAVGKTVALCARVRASTRSVCCSVQCTHLPHAHTALLLRPGSTAATRAIVACSCQTITYCPSATTWTRGAATRRGGGRGPECRGDLSAPVKTVVSSQSV